MFLCFWQAGANCFFSGFAGWSVSHCGQRPKTKCGILPVCFRFDRTVVARASSLLFRGRGGKILETVNLGHRRLLADLFGLWANAPSLVAVCSCRAGGRRPQSCSPPLCCPTFPFLGIPVSHKAVRGLYGIRGWCASSPRRTPCDAPTPSRPSLPARANTIPR